MKKISILKMSILSLCMIAILSTSIFAVEIVGTLNYWYSGYNGIAKWTNSPSYSITRTNSCPSSFDTNAISAFSVWDTAGVPSSYKSSGGTIEVTGGPYVEIKSINPSFSTTSTGETPVAMLDTGGYYSTPSGNKKALTMIEAEIYICTDRASTKTYRHEVAHSLGWCGHSSNNLDVMYASNTSVSQLTSRDKNHLNQIY